MNRPPEQEVANRAAHQPDGAADDPATAPSSGRSGSSAPSVTDNAATGSRIRRTRQCRAAPRPAPATASAYRAALNSFTSPASNSTSTLGPLDTGVVEAEASPRDASAHQRSP